jgi:hypothetical protein
MVDCQEMYAICQLLAHSVRNEPGDLLVGIKMVVRTYFEPIDDAREIRCAMNE